VPYTVNWSTTTIGSYRIKAIAYNDSGNSIASEEVTIEVEEEDKSDLTDDVYVLKNVVTNKYLTDSGVSATEVSMSDSGLETNTYWRFVETGTYHNIDSETFGILRATGAGFDNGNKPYFVVSTGKSAPAADSDKVWTIHYNETDDTFRFESKDNNRFLYDDENGNVTNIEAEETDGRSKWVAIQASQVLSTSANLSLESPIKIYPNPAKNNFIISLKGIDKVAITIHDILGKTIYKNVTTNRSIELSTSNGFTAGMYIIRVVSGGQTYQNKLIIK